MSTETGTATVQVLTAEVRVLQVGSRQVTLSVAKQLDHVEPSEIEPFGRVKLHDYGYLNATTIEVIGSAGGVLVCSSAHRWVNRCSGRITFPDNDKCPQVIAKEEHQEHSWYIYGRGCDRTLFDAWSALPLIVLAGLK